MSIFCDRAAENLSDAVLPELAYSVIDRAVRDAASGDPTAGAWLLSDQAEVWADVAGFDKGFLGQLANRVLEGLANGS